MLCLFLPVVLDRREDKTCDTGRFELAWKLVSGLKRIRIATPLPPPPTTPLPVPPPPSPFIRANFFYLRSPVVHYFRALLLSSRLSSSHTSALPLTSGSICLWMVKPSRGPQSFVVRSLRPRWRHSLVPRKARTPFRAARADKIPPQQRRAAAWKEKRTPRTRRRRNAVRRGPRGPGQQAACVLPGRRFPWQRHSARVTRTSWEGWCRVTLARSLVSRSDAAPGL